jgi:hypothetical protein
MWGRFLFEPFGDKRLLFLDKTAATLVDDGNLPAVMMLMFPRGGDRRMKVVTRH